MPPHGSPRLAVRALILHQDCLLLVNAYPEGQSDLWCAPGGGVVPGQSLPDNLIREVFEETGMTVAVGDLAMVNEFHDPATGYHQVDLFFRCTVIGGEVSPIWQDPDQVVTQRLYASRETLATLRFKPDSLPQAAWGSSGVIYDPLEVIVP
jgi:8-oxo-dGTP diphosphatase